MNSKNGTDIKEADLIREDIESRRAKITGKTPPTEKKEEKANNNEPKKPNAWEIPKPPKVKKRTFTQIRIEDATVERLKKYCFKNERESYAKVANEILERFLDLHDIK